ncbi:MAG: hypothetical protein CVU30_04225 [Betaproteobacteria bacterium HGW-Betaproteobacteria-3]|jgi:hypothetical protein|nr:MAG: hypothetical protein CVU30_04225 [Betaproteobacteria bacterium HGW-Betaproteobacteria-3]
MNKLLIGIAATCIGLSTAWAKLPAPSDEAKAKAAAAAAKTAHGGKVAAYKLCKSQDSTVERYQKTAKAAGKTVKPPVAMPACADPGPFVEAPAAAAAAPAPAKKS